MATLITVTGTYLNTDGTAAEGMVSFSLNEPIANGDFIYHLFTQKAVLDGSGAISQVLVANDDVGTTPTGSFYTVTEHITDAPEREYQIIVSHTVAGATVDLSVLMPNTQPGIG